MNEQRYARVVELAELLDSFHDDLYALAYEEDEARAIMPSVFCESERYVLSADASVYLCKAADLINDALEVLSLIETPKAVSICAPEIV